MKGGAKVAHGIGLADFHEKVFLFKQLAFASQGYCRNEGLCSTPTTRAWSEEPWCDYSYTLRTMVSSYLLEFAVKARVLAESIRSQLPVPAHYEELKALGDQLSGGVVHEGSFSLTLYEVCNKIVHATRVELGWVDRCVKTSRRYTHWSGSIHLHGRHHGELWHVELSAAHCADEIYWYVQFLADFADEKGLKSILPD